MKNDTPDHSTPNDLSGAAAQLVVARGGLRGGLAAWQPHSWRRSRAGTSYEGELQ
jgi:hypothetical protein